MFSHDWFSNNISVWEKLLAEFRGVDGLRALEIGCYEGRATLWLCQNILTGNNAKIQVVDTFEGSMEHENAVDFSNTYKNFTENLAEYWGEQKHTVDIYKGTSETFLLEARYRKPMQENIGIFEPYHIIYIDGSHIAKDVLQDAVLAWELLNEDGIMIFDDVEWDKYKEPFLNPKLAVNSFLEVYKNRYDILHKGYQVIIKKNERDFNKKTTNDTN